MSLRGGGATWRVTTAVHRFGRLVTRGPAVVAVAVVCILASLSVAPALQAQDQSDATDGLTRCDVPFEVTVRQGPSAGLHITGTLSLGVDGSGAVTGVLLSPTAGAFAVGGQVTGHAISLLLEPGDGSVLYGTGVAEYPVADCHGAMGGPVVGPQPGDSGDWAVVQLVTPVAQALHTIGPSTTISAPATPTSRCGSSGTVLSGTGIGAGLTVGNTIALSAQFSHYKLGGGVEGLILISVPSGCSAPTGVTLTVTANGVNAVASFPGAGGGASAVCVAGSGDCVYEYTAGGQLAPEFAASGCISLQATAVTGGGAIRSPSQTVCLGQ